MALEDAVDGVFASDGPLARALAAFEPRGRVHYFVNETEKPMAMIWVYAGPKPERIVVHERNATAEGNPWQ